MASGHLETTWHHICSLLGSVSAADTADAHLLARFVAEHDDAAFAELVRRHGAMVHGVCRRVLTNAHDAEDARAARGGRKSQGLHAHLDTFEWTLKLMPQDKDQLPPGQLLTVSLHVKAYRVDPTKGFAEARITKEQAAKIIDVLAKDNFFRESVADHSRLPAVPEGPYALMCMNHDQKNQQTQDVQRVTACRVLERDANLVKRLQAIRQCVDGEAAQMIGQLLKSLPAEGDADKIRGAWKVVSAIQTSPGSRTTKTWSSTRTASGRSATRSSQSRRVSRDETRLHPRPHEEAKANRPRQGPCRDEPETAGHLQGGGRQADNQLHPLQLPPEKLLHAQGDPSVQGAGGAGAAEEVIRFGEHEYNYHQTMGKEIGVVEDL